MELVYYVGGVGGSGGGGKIMVGVGGWLVRVPECTLAPLLMRIMFKGYRLHFSTLTQ